MDSFDVVVLGGGSGSQVATAAAASGLEAAVVERGPLGGACITRGCVPSKAWIHRADLLETIRDVDRFGVDATADGLEYGRVRDEIRDTVYEKATRQERSLRETDGLTLYEGTARFVDDRTLLVDDGEREPDDESRGDDESDGVRIRGEQVVIAVGARPTVPPIDGLDEVDFLTSTEALYLDEAPDELVVIGGGYVGVELAHVFAAVGTDVSIVGRSDRLVPGEDATIADRVTTAFERQCSVYTGYEADAVTTGDDGRVTVTAVPTGEEAVGDGGEAGEAGEAGGEDEPVELSADELLVAAGRRPNTDTLDLEETGVETDDAGHVAVDEFLETDVDGIWALGDVLADHPFKHAADYEARLVSRNMLASDVSEIEPVDYAGMPHAIFADPRVASLGSTEADLEEDGREYESATVEYAAAPLGMIREERDGVAKVLAAPDGEILGCHVVGGEAETMIHEVVTAIRAGSGTVDDIAAGIHVHPTLAEVLQRAFVELSDRPYVAAPDWRETAGDR